ncbi:MAG: hypothetical protein HY784_10190 [Chloroflexi bacterium]|nr:hypothetical protein [Chloroflexota bacterium]
MSVSVTIQVPTYVYRLAEQTASATRRPVEQVLENVVTSASPVGDDLPPDLQAELELLAQLPDRELWRVARSTMPDDRRRASDRLLERNSAGTITAAERRRLSELGREGDRLMLRKAHAYALLKWRGHKLPALNQLPLPE